MAARCAAEAFNTTETEILNKKTTIKCLGVHILLDHTHIVRTWHKYMCNGLCMIHTYIPMHISERFRHSTLYVFDAAI